MARRTPCLVALVLVVAGCGGDPAARDEAPAKPRAAASARPGPDAPATRAALVADARRICARMDSRMGNVVRRQQAPSPAQVGRIVDAWAVTVAELRDLRPPPAEAARFRRMLASFETAIRAGRAVDRATGEQALVPIAVMADAGMKGASIADGYGLLTCSIFPPAPSRAEFERYILEQARKEGGLLSRRALDRRAGRDLRVARPSPKLSRGDRDGLSGRR